MSKQACLLGSNGALPDTLGCGGFVACKDHMSVAVCCGPQCNHMSQGGDGIIGCGVQGSMLIVGGSA